MNKQYSLVLYVNFNKPIFSVNLYKERFLIDIVKNKILKIIRNEKNETKNLTIIIDQSFYSLKRLYLLREADISSYDEELLETLLSFFLESIFKKKKSR